MYEWFNILASRYNTTIDNVLSIALNRYGIIMDNCSDNRIRFNLRFNDSERENYFAVCVNTYAESPFSIKENTLYLENIAIGKVLNIEKDTCTATYFRNNKKAITLNSNSRSKCFGCKFCGTYCLTEDDNYDFSTVDNVKQYFNILLQENNITSMRDIDSITICTGCFNSENDLIKHIYILNDAFSSMQFKGRLNYIGSQLRTFDKIKEIKKKVNNFGLYLTIEKFLDREKFMKSEKSSLTLEKAKELLTYCSSIGITTTFLYILGLEDLKTIEKYFEYFKDSVNKFPIIQVFQDYTEYQENYRHQEAKDVEYYLKARKIVDSIYEETSLKPKTWESFRGLYTLDKNDIGDDKCLKKI